MISFFVPPRALRLKSPASYCSDGWCIVVFQLLNPFEEKWAVENASIGPAWRQAWQEVIPVFAFDPAIRKIIYMTSAIESLNRVSRKSTKTRSAFPTDEAATKLSRSTCSSMHDASATRTGQARYTEFTTLPDHEVQALTRALISGSMDQTEVTRKIGHSRKDRRPVLPQFET